MILMVIAIPMNNVQLEIVYQFTMRTTNYIDYDMIIVLRALKRSAGSHNYSIVITFDNLYNILVISTR